MLSTNVCNSELQHAQIEEIRRPNDYDYPMATAFLSNHFLLALPTQISTYFEDTVTYLVHHDEEGAMGLVVNRPLPLKLGDVLKEANLQPEGEDISPIMEGGPVSPAHPFIIHSSDFETKSSTRISDEVSFTAQSSKEGIFAMLEAISKGTGPSKYLFCLGYAGWGAGQLENELKENSWVTCPADTKILFDEPFKTRAEKVSSSIGVDLSKFSPQSGMA